MVNPMKQPNIYNPSLHDNHFEDEIRNVAEILEAAGYEDNELPTYEEDAMPQLAERKTLPVQHQMIISEIMDVFQDYPEGTNPDALEGIEKVWYVQCLCKGQRGESVKVLAFESEEDARNCTGFHFDV